MKPGLAKHIAELVDGDGWQLADLLLEEFPVEEFGDGGKANSGLYEELRQYESVLAKEYGVILKVSTMRDYRSTALAWPHALRNASASFVVHKRIRGAERQTEMAKRLKQAAREKSALSERLLARYRADERPLASRSFEERLRRAIANAARRELLGGRVTKKADWWNADTIGDADRAMVVRELRALANAINKDIDA